MPDSPRKENQPKENPLMEKNSQNLQDNFLNNLRKERTPVTILLVGGVKLTGKIKGFDKYALVLETNNQEQLVFKHAISTVAVAQAAQPTSPAFQVAEA